MFQKLLPPLFAAAEQMQPAFDPLEQTDFKGAFFKMVGSIALIIGVVFLILWLVKRFSNNRLMALNKERYIKVIEKRPISPKTMLYIIEVADKQMILAESQLEVRELNTKISEDS